MVIRAISLNFSTWFGVGFGPWASTFGSLLISSTEANPSMIFLTIFYYILKHFQIKIREKETCKGRSKLVHVDSELLPHWTYEMKVSRTLIKVFLYVLSTGKVISQTLKKIPSYPVMQPNPSIMFCRLHKTIHQYENPGLENNASSEK